MLPLLRFALLLMAILAIPWLASNPPKWPSGIDNDALQGWGAVAAVLGGFAYVGFQRWLDRRADNDRRQRMQRHLLRISRDGASDAYQRAQKFEDAAKIEGGRIKTLYGRDLLHEVADEMMAVRLDDIGSPEVLTEVRRVAFALRAFAHVCTEHYMKPLGADAIEEIIEYRNSILGSTMGLHRACGSNEPLELGNGHTVQWGEEVGS